MSFVHRINVSFFAFLFFLLRCAGTIILVMDNLLERFVICLLPVLVTEISFLLCAVCK